MPRFLSISTWQIWLWHLFLADCTNSIVFTVTFIKQTIAMPGHKLCILVLFTLHCCPIPFNLSPPRMNILYFWIHHKSKVCGTCKRNASVWNLSKLTFVLTLKDEWSNWLNMMPCQLTAFDSLSWMRPINYWMRSFKTKSSKFTLTEEVGNNVWP